MEERKRQTKEKHEKKSKKKHILLTVILIVSIGVFLFAGYQIISILIEDHNQSSEVEYLKNLSIKNSEQTDQSSEGIDWHDQIDFEALHELNDQIVGWLYLKDTVIDYPIVQGTDNDYYLTKTFLKKGNRAGSIFLDYRNAANFLDSNSVLYGHNMKNGSMFHELVEYKNQEYFEQHPIINLYTPQGTYELAIFSAYITTADDPYTQTTFATENEKQAFLDRISSASLIETGVQATAEDRIVTFSTCTYETDNARFVVHAKFLQ